MADKFWSSASGTWNAASFGGVLPVTGDNMRADGRSTQDFTTSLDRTGDLYITERVTNGGFAADSDWTKGTGWAIAAGVATKTAGVASDLSQAGILTLTQGYYVTFTVSGRTAGSVTVKCGTTGAGTSRSTNATFSEIVTCSGSTALIFSATDTFDGSIDNVSVTARGLYLNTVEFMRSYLGDVAAAGSELKLACDDFIWRAPGELYFIPASSGEAVKGITRLTIDTPNRTQLIDFGATYVSSHIRHIRVLQGRYKHSELVAVLSAFVGYRNNAASDAYFEVAEGGTIQDIMQIAGVMIYNGTQGSSDKMLVAGGYCQLNGYANIYRQTGGRCEIGMHPEEVPTLTPVGIAEAWLLSGSMDSVLGSESVITTAYIGPKFEISDEALALITTPIYLDKEN